MTTSAARAVPDATHPAPPKAAIPVYLKATALAAESATRPAGD